MILQHAINIPIAPNKHYFKKAGQSLNFTLAFPKVPENWASFEMKEIANSRGFLVNNIQRNNSGIYRITVT